MLKKSFLPLFLILLLALPAAGVKSPDPGKTAAAKVRSGQTVIIKTAPKDVKDTKVGKKGEIEIPQSDSISKGLAVDSYSGFYSDTGGSAPIPWATPETAAPSSELIKDPDGNSADTSLADTERAAGGGPGSPGSGDYRGTSGSGSSDSRLGSGFGIVNNSGDAFGGISFSVAPFNFSGDQPAVPLPSTSTSSTTSTTTTTTFPSASLQAVLNSAVSDTGVPGAILAVQTQWGYWNWIGAAGKSDLATDQAMTTDMQFHLDGVTKLFTAALIMKLVEEGKLSLDDTVEKWLPGVLYYDGDRITVRMLLNHTSGLYDYEVDPYFTDYVLADPSHVWLTEPLRSPIDDELIWNYGWFLLTLFSDGPGTDFYFSNANYHLLGPSPKLPPATPRRWRT